MKTYYKIHEISKLYNIGPDSLRYYEKLGLLHPKRDKNGYRMYNLKDLYKLTVIRDLRELNFSMKQIGEYLNGQSLDNTISLLEQEQKALRRQRKLLQLQEKRIASRILDLKEAKTTKEDHVRVLELPQRCCVQLCETITRDEEMDFLIKKLQRRHEKQIRDLGSQIIGAWPDPDQLRQGRGNVFTSVFFVLEENTDTADFLLPAGQYLSCYYRGSYDQNIRCLQTIWKYAKEHHITLAGEPFELYEVDNRDTSCPEEFLTEIQIKIQDVE